MSLNNINHIDLVKGVEGDELRLEHISDILASGTFMPKTVEYKDIDDDFKRWVKEDLRIVSDDGVLFPTVPLFSNQRFSEYSLTWSHTDSNNNLMLNFISMIRENNPQYGKIQAGLFNIPGDRFYTMKKIKALDDNGTESWLFLKMKQPVSIDLNYKLSIFTTKYEKINEFNTLINKKFAARQCYLCPNGHHMPMVLENISDESEYNIEDRQFYSQTFTIRTMGYIITEDDMRVDEVPLKVKTRINNIVVRKPEVELDGYEDTYFDRYTITIRFPERKNVANFTMDMDFIMDKAELDNILSNFTVHVNGTEISQIYKHLIREGDDIEVRIKRKSTENRSVMKINGIDPNSLKNTDGLVKYMQFTTQGYLDGNNARNAMEVVNKHNRK